MFHSIILPLITEHIKAHYVVVIHVLRGIFTSHLKVANCRFDFFSKCVTAQDYDVE